MDTSNIPHGFVPPVTLNSHRIDTVSALTQDRGNIFDDPKSALACQSSKITIPRKRSDPFSKDVPRKRIKTERSIKVRIYEKPTDLRHTDEIEYALTPDGGLDLVGLCQRLKVDECQASQLTQSPFMTWLCSYLLKVLPARSLRPWYGKNPVLDRGAIKLLQAKEGYLRVVGRSSSSLVR